MMHEYVMFKFPMAVLAFLIHVLSGEAQPHTRTHTHIHIRSGDRNDCLTGCLVPDEEAEVLTGCLQLHLMHFTRCFTGNGTVW